MRAVRYIIEEDKKFGTVILEGIPRKKSHRNWTMESRNRYRLMFQSSCQKGVLLDKDTLYFFNRDNPIKISKPYKSWESFVEDNIELFL